MEHCTCGSAVPWCARADALFNLPGVHVLDVARDQRDRLIVSVETDADVGGCPSCGVVAVGHGRRIHAAADAPCFGAVTVVRWRKRVWRCAEPARPVGAFSEKHDLIAPRGRLTPRAGRGATDALTHDDTTVSALARHLGVHWHTLRNAVEDEAARRLADPGWLAGVGTPSVDEHIWRPFRIGDADRALTGMVDLTRDERGNLH